MISKRQWCKIGSGDILVDRGGTRRVVISGPRDVAASVNSHGSLMYVTLSIRHRSWTGRAYTIVGYNDAKRRFTIPMDVPTRGMKASSCMENLQKLVDCGFDVVAEAKRELAELLRMESVGFRVRDAEKKRLRLLIQRKESV